MVLDLLKYLVIAYLALWGFAWLFGNQAMFPAPQPHSTDNLFFLDTAKGDTISLKYYPAKASPWVILYSHGNAEDIGRLEPYFQFWQQQGISLLAYDYPGYGESTGKPNEQTVYAAIHAAYQWLSQRHDPQHIILYGRSVGSGPTVELATQQKTGGVVIESGFVSAFRTVTVYPILPNDVFKNLSKVDRISSPLWVIHGRNDTVVPFWHGKKLFEAAHHPKISTWVDTGHNDVWRASEILWKDFNQFLTLIKDQPPDTSSH